MSDPAKAVFLSYASQDAEAARRIRDVLGAAGVEVWFDQSELVGGDAWDRKIRKQIKECALFVPVISANTQARAEGYFRLEWLLAIERSRLMAEDQTFLLPVVIDDISDAVARVPDKFRDVQWTRLIATDAPTAFAARVLALLTGVPEPARSETRSVFTTPPASGSKSKRVAAPELEPDPSWRPAPDQIVPGTKWILERKLGEGGFGEVWLGRHQTMKERRVFKFCFEAERVRSLKRELTLFRVLKERVGGHPNIVRLLDVHFDEPPYYVEMDYVDGQDLKSWCAQHGGVEKLPLTMRLEMVAQIADALHAAHSAGVIHRDVKPGNILVSQSTAANAQPVAKLSDFGIGQVLSDEALEGITKSGFTKSMVADSAAANSGTQLYMAPELLAGNAASIGTDLYSLGVVLFQLVVGDLRRPLTTDWTRAVDDPVLREDLTKCFASRQEERFASADELARSLRAFDQRRVAFRAEQAVEAARLKAAKRWTMFRTVGIAAVVIGLGASLVWFLQRSSKLRWARQQALPEISRLLQANEIPAAFALAIEVEKYLPDDPALTSLWPRIAVATSIETTPAGAEVAIKEYRKPDSEWRLLGKSPMKNIRLPKFYYRWRIRQEGSETVEQAAGVTAAIKFFVPKTGEIPRDMVRVPGSTTNGAFTGFASVQLDDYLIDRYEVTNRQFKEFVDRGGYTHGDFWKQPFVKAGITLPLTEALAGFVDTTGKPGPATWAKGTYPEGQADYPVTGVSWFEAVAYAEFAGKRLPSVSHWRSAALVASFESIVPLSNFSGKGLAPVGSQQGMSASGAYDMAGNAKEWCWNEAGPGDRYILGGAWNEPKYMFGQADAMSAFNRAPQNGFRCIKLLSSAPLAERVDAPVVRVRRDYAQEKPVSDEEFRSFRSLFAYDPTKLDERIDAVDDSDPRWRREKVSFKAAYGTERMSAILFLPKRILPPYQTIVFFPGADAHTASRPSSDELASMERVTFLVAGGRALIYPIYWGTFERGVGLPRIPPSRNSIAYRDSVVNQSKDLGRSIDYLETRTDIQRDKLAYVGYSWGGAMGSVLTALEPRLKVNVFVIGGFYTHPVQREADQINFAPRIKIPTLMLNGRDDFTFPLETSQKPMYRFLGTPPEHKRHVLYDSGHQAPNEPSAKEIHDWLDKYFGPVK